MASDHRAVGFLNRIRVDLWFRGLGSEFGGDHLLAQMGSLPVVRTLGCRSKAPSPVPEEDAYAAYSGDDADRYANADARFCASTQTLMTCGVSGAD